MNTLDKILPLTLAHEGGFSNHPQDPGGATMKGVTQRVYDAYRQRKGLKLRSVRHISDTELVEIYDKQYFEEVRGDELPAGLDYAVFDYAVNSGPGRAIKDLQRTAGVDADGHFGDETWNAVMTQMAADEEGFIQRYCERRMRFLRSLRTWKTFGRGWARRVVGDHDGFQEGDHGVIDYAVMMARNDLSFPLREADLPNEIGAKEGEVAGKGEEAQVAVSRTPAGIGTIISATGASGQTIISAAEQVKPHINETPLGKIAFVVFLVMMLAGGALLAYTFYRRLKDKGAI